LRCAAGWFIPISRVVLVPYHSRLTIASCLLPADFCYLPYPIFRCAIVCTSPAASRKAVAAAAAAAPDTMHAHAAGLRRLTGGMMSGPGTHVSDEQAQRCARLPRGNITDPKRPTVSWTRTRFRVLVLTNRLSGSRADVRTNCLSCRTGSNMASKLLPPPRAPPLRVG
jgi:hypothetical protein